MRKIDTLTLLFTSLLGCGSNAALQRELSILRERFDNLEKRERERDERQTKTETDFRRVWSRVACNSESVKDFLRTCEQEGGTCSQLDVANAFKDFLDTQEYVRAHLHLEKSIERMIKLRRTQLEDLTDKNDLHAGTRFIVVVLPRSGSAAHDEEAMRVGRDMIRFLHIELNVPKSYRILGPRTLPCNFKRQELLRQRRRIDGRQLNEPFESDPMIHIWVFKTSCQ